MDEIEALGAAIHQQMLRDRENKRQTDRDARLAAAEALLREAVATVEWWTPDEYEANMSIDQAQALNDWYAQRDRIDSFLSGKTNEGSGG